MTRDEVVLDARGEPCPGPALKVEGFLRRAREPAPFRILVDHRASAESLERLGAALGFRVEIEEAGGEWCVRFQPGEPG